MRYVFAVALLATVVTPAYAQFNQNREKTPLQLQYERQEQEQRENERQYEVQMKRLKTQAPTATSNDPWRKVRPATDASGKK